MAGTTVSGVGSNIDTQAIVASLVAAEKAPKQTQINNQTLKATTSLSSIGKIQAALDAFRGALDNMKTASSFSGLTGSSSDEKVATVTTGNGAAAGSFSLLVTQLATASKLSTKVFASGASSVVNAGAAPTTLNIKQGTNTFAVSVPAGATLQQVRDSINSQYANQGLSANIVTDANGSRMVLTSTTTGVGSDLTLTGDSGLETGTSILATPQNAQYKLDGLAMESKTNTIADAVSGVTLKLTGASVVPSGGGAATPTTISVAASSATLKSSVKGFVDSYNALIKAANAETQVTTNADGSVTSGALTGDASLRSMLSAVRTELNAMSGTGQLKALSQFGVQTDQKTGLLSINDKLFDAAALTNAADINGIFSGDTGLLARMKSATDSFALSKTGVFAARSATLTDSLTDLKKQQDTLDARMVSLQTSLTAKYTAMDSLVARLRAQSDSVLATLNALNKSNSDD
ncbi:flagellar filament capping protein FliD [Pseudomonas thivervalensis]|uniref:Flagellar hook-associated protein 2 n=1 Tax=Pseudomonas thivervalensis TaxID=86265 RepID=A0A176NH39_9PSED|nr:flagellar filament capping protein FliD [Pseudomonas thivervalensis]AXA55053.1 flagellar cap protein FliD [Pseudomonas thivervalensis]AXA60736.1 flagellar cap protein FliD [Pseudomonas thivervalensis]OAB50469.1 flagellar cap protein FliD [Pseudomonas thivervalensis]SDF93990.1 flagellar hook-associated protein 2 [Pseudomonas thivervalensis]